MKNNGVWLLFYFFFAFILYLFSEVMNIKLIFYFYCLRKDKLFFYIFFFIENQ